MINPTERHADHAAEMAFLRTLTDQELRARRNRASDELSRRYNEHQYEKEKKCPVSPT